MPELLERSARTPPAHNGGRPLAPPRPSDERAARRTLLAQIAHLETDLGALFCSTYPRAGFEWGVASRGGPRVLPLAELERVRDDLADRLQENRSLLSERTYVEELHRRRIEEMMLEPEKFKWHRISNQDIGETSCRHWHVRPRFGVLGVLMSWWRVRISSGCPLAEGRGHRP